MGDRLELRVDRPAFGGGVIARAPDGRVVFLRGAAPGDAVEAELVEVRKRFARGRIVRLTPGDARADSFCPYATRCGGCPWMPIPLSEQRAALEAHVRRDLQRLGTDSVDWGAIVTPAPDRAWRSTARLHWHDRRIGYRAAGDRAIVDVEACAVLRPPLPALFDAIRRTLGPHLGGRGTLRITADPDVSTGTVELRPAEGTQPGLRDALRALVEADGPCHGAVWVSGGRTESFGRPHNLLDGVLHPAEAFVQAHRTGNRLLTAAVLDAVAGGPAGPVLELFAGSGNFTFALADAGRAVTAVEIDAAAARALEEAARQRGLGERVRAFTGDAGRLSATTLAAIPGGPAVAVIDPPRVGARRAVGALAGLGPRLRRIVYVSCNPATLARDGKLLTGRGWRLVAARPFDLFPHTGHVEVLAVFDRSG